VEQQQEQQHPTVITVVALHHHLAMVAVLARLFPMEEETLTIIPTADAVIPDLLNVATEDQVAADIVAVRLTAQATAVARLLPTTVIPDVAVHQAHTGKLQKKKKTIGLFFHYCFWISLRFHSHVPGRITVTRKERLPPASCGFYVHNVTFFFV